MCFYLQSIAHLHNKGKCHVHCYVCLLYDIEIFCTRVFSWREIELNNNNNNSYIALYPVKVYKLAALALQSVIANES